MLSRQLFRRGNRLDFQPGLAVRWCRDVGFLSVGSSVITPLGKARGSAHASWERMFLRRVGLIVFRNWASSSGCTCSPTRVSQGTGATVSLGNGSGASLQPPQDLLQIRGRCLPVSHQKALGQDSRTECKGGGVDGEMGAAARSSLKFPPNTIGPFVPPAFVVRSTGTCPTRANES